MRHQARDELQQVGTRIRPADGLSVLLGDTGSITVLFGLVGPMASTFREMQVPGVRALTTVWKRATRFPAPV